MMNEEELKKVIEKALKEKDIESVIKLIQEILEFDKKIMKLISEIKDIDTKARLQNIQEKLDYVA